MKKLISNVLALTAMMVGLTITLEAAPAQKTCPLMIEDEIDVEELRRLFYFLVDTVLERPEMPTPSVVSLGVTAPLG